MSPQSQSQAQQQQQLQPRSSCSAKVSPGRKPGRIACVAVIAANVSEPTHFKSTRQPQLTNHFFPHCIQNQPLYFRTFPSSTDFSSQQLQQVIYNSLDVIEERTSPHRIELGNYMGCLAVVGQLSVYGSLTATRRKILVGFVTMGGTELEQGGGKDGRIDMLFRKLEVGIAKGGADCFRGIDDIGGQAVELAVGQAVEWFG